MHQVNSKDARSGVVISKEWFYSPPHHFPREVRVIAECWTNPVGIGMLIPFAEVLYRKKLGPERSGDTGIAVHILRVNQFETRVCRTGKQLRELHISVFKQSPACSVRSVDVSQASWSCRNFYRLVIKSTHWCYLS